MNLLSLTELQNCEADAKLLEEDENATPLLDSFTETVIDRLSSWEQPWM
jgi:hypothetical protein